MGVGSDLATALSARLEHKTFLESVHVESASEVFSVGSGTVVKSLPWFEAGKARSRWSRETRLRREVRTALLASDYV